jgi:hypothetical protein
MLSGWSLANSEFNVPSMTKLLGGSGAQGGTVGDWVGEAIAANAKRMRRALEENLNLVFDDTCPRMIRRNARSNTTGSTPRGIQRADRSETGAGSLDRRQIHDAGRIPYKMSSRLGVLGYEIGLPITSNCKSNRNSDANVHMRDLAIQMPTKGELHASNQPRSREEKFKSPCSCPGSWQQKAAGPQCRWRRLQAQGHVEGLRRRARASLAITRSRSIPGGTDATLGTNGVREKSLVLGIKRREAKMDRGQSDIVVADLGLQLGIPGLALNDDGMGILSLDEGAVIVAIGFNKQAGSIDLMTCLDKVDASPARSVAALRANFGWDAPGCETLAVDPLTGAFVLQRRYFGQDLVDGGLAGAVQGLVAQAERWTRRLTSMADIGSVRDGQLGDIGGGPAGGVRA